MKIPMESVTRYLETMVGGVRPRKAGDAFRGPGFITISRQAGAGGHSLAEALIRRIEKETGPLYRGWQVFDKKIAEIMAADPKLRVSVQLLTAKEYRSEWEDMASRLIANVSPQSQVIGEIFKMLITLASAGKVILVGYGGACLTREIPGGVFVRLVASPSSRLQRMVRLLGVSEKEAQRVIAEQDKARAVLVRDCFSRDIEDPLNYDITVNTDEVPMDCAADMVFRLLWEKIRGGKISHAWTEKV